MDWLAVGVGGLTGAVGGAALGGAFKHSKSAKGWFDLSQKWKNVSPRVRNAQDVPKNQELHHWLIERNSWLGKRTPDWIKNHPLNLNPVSETFHTTLHRLDPVSRTVIGAPGWAQAGAGTAAAAGAANATLGNCGCD